MNPLVHLSHSMFNERIVAVATAFIAVVALVADFSLA